MNQQQKLSAEQYAECISGVYSAIASVKSARDGEQASELMRLNAAIDRLTRARLARKNEALSLRCGEAVKAAYQAIAAADRRAVDLADVGLGLCNQLSLAHRAEAACAGAIDVLCIALPDGGTLWTDNTDTDAIGRVISSWRDRLPPAVRERYDAAKVVGGFVMCRMLREDYSAIAATNESAALFGGSNG